MPFIDLNEHDATTYSIPENDVIIIGAGAAGILISIKLSEKGKRVVLIESGHFGEDENKQVLNHVEQTAKVLQNAVWGRKRAVGGTTIAWGGQSLPFMPIDFIKRDWVKNSGWPIDYETVEPFYKEANSFMNIDTLNYTSDIFAKIYFKDPGINNQVFDIHVSKWADQPNFYLLYKNQLQTNVTVVYNAQVSSIKKSADQISSITVSNFKGFEFETSVNKLIIAAGTIETVRLLLANKIADDLPALGKCFMEHPCIEVGKIKTNNNYRLQQFFNTHVWNEKKYSIRLTLNQDYQKKNELLNCSGSIMFQLPDDVFDPYGELRSFKKDFKLSRLVKISKSIVSISKSLFAYSKDKFYYKPNAIPKIALMVEQEPVEESYISLSDKKDKFGVREALINWDITSKTWDTVVNISSALKSEFEKLNLGKVELYSYIKSGNKNFKEKLTDVCHHMGGTRMSPTSQEGVVDTNLKVWGNNNLYVCSCSVFPTSSHSNPTLTMLALAVRLADHLTKNNSNVK